MLLSFEALLAGGNLDATRVHLGNKVGLWQIDKTGCRVAQLWLTQLLLSNDTLSMVMILLCSLRINLILITFWIRTWQPLFFFFFVTALVCTNHKLCVARRNTQLFFLKLATLLVSLRLNHLLLLLPLVLFLTVDVARESLPRIALQFEL